MDDINLVISGEMMKRAINIFTALILTVVLAFGSQVASAFAYAQPDNFTLEPQSGMPVHVDPYPFLVLYTNNSPEDIEVFAEAYPDSKKTIVPSGQSVHDFLLPGAPFVFFYDNSNSPIQVTIQQ
ncbi:MAG: hypothetical protein AAFW70_28715 [Cyanobacteria bacterium J06635_10]